VIQCFPDDETKRDRTWLPLHFAVISPDTDLEEDIETIIISQPQAIKLKIDDVYVFNSFHLAVIVEDPSCVQVIQLLQENYSFLGSSLAEKSNTVLHLAAVMHSNSVAFVQELIQPYFLALEMRNNED
jgi:hypothetical protein